ncbi:unnamed protein product [Ectocarpus sp. CCAP 1310/34]|nr:unnamed protein product [Ectocarpus sp. CCAP 1310/34]
MDQRSETGVIDKHRPDISLLEFWICVVKAETELRAPVPYYAAELPQQTQLRRAVASRCCRTGRVVFLCRQLGPVVPHASVEEKNLPSDTCGQGPAAKSGIS